MSPQPQQPFTVTADVPAGNAIIERVADGEVRLRQDQRGSTERWFYWRFAVRGAQGRRVRFIFTDWAVVGTRGPCVSRDGGRTWRWLGRDDADDTSFAYRFGDDEADVQFCFCLPYLQSHLDAFLAERGDNIRRGELCRSPSGRPVPLLELGPADAPHRVLITARHHACESSASFVLEALLDAAAHAPPDTPAGWLRAHARITAIPFVDKDGVEHGDQGKTRLGHDHNRDYIAKPRYPETAAIMAMCRAAPPIVALDLHCPWIRGGYNERVYQVGSSEPSIWRQQQRFGQLLEAQPGEGLGYRAADDLPWGQDWNTGVATAEACSSTKWMGQQGAKLASSFETPYANAREELVAPASLRGLGVRMAAALGTYLSEIGEG